MIDWADLWVRTIGADSKAAPPKNIRLPALPTAVTEFTRLSADPEVPDKKLAAIVEQDAGLTCALLKEANSTFYGLTKKASTTQQALNLLGIRQCKLLVLATGVKLAMQAVQSKLINFRNFSNANLERALFAREVARLMKADVDLAFAGALLQDCLLPAMTNEMYPKYVRFLSAQDSRPTSLSAYEQRELGWDHALASARVMAAWRFPDDLVCCVAYHHRLAEVVRDPQLWGSAIAAVALSGLLPDQMRQTPDGLEQLAMLEQAWPEFRLTEVVDVVDQQFREFSPTANDFPLRARCRKVLAAMAGA